MSHVCLNHIVRGIEVCIILCAVGSVVSLGEESNSNLNNWVRFTTSNSELIDDFSDQAFSVNGKLWITHFNGVSSVGDSGQIFHRPIPKIGNAFIDRIMPDGWGRLWLISPALGILSLSGVNVDEYLMDGQLVEGRVDFAVLSESGEMWIVVDEERLGRFHQDNWHFYDIPSPTKAVGRIQFLYVDKFDRAWLSYSNWGVVKMENSVWSEYRQELKNFPGSTANFVIESPGENSVAMVVDKSAIVKYTRGEFAVASYAQLPIDSAVVVGDVVCFLHDGVAITSWDGRIASLYNSSEFDGTDSLLASEVVNGDIWIATEKGGVCRFSGGSWDIVPRNFPSVTTIDATSDGTIWVGTTRGVYRLSMGNWFSPGPRALQSAEIRFIKESGGFIWFGTFEDGLFRYTPPNGELEVNKVVNKYIESELCLAGEGDPRDWKLYYVNGRIERTESISKNWLAKIDASDMHLGVNEITIYAVDRDGSAVLSSGSRNVVVEKRYQSTVSKFTNWAKVPAILYVASWVVLISLYPVSSTVRRNFFWNSKVRKATGLYLIDFAIFTIPKLGVFMMSPFIEQSKRILISRNIEIYKKVRIIAERCDETHKTITAGSLPAIKGQMLLIGASGTGKTTLAECLALKSKNTILVRAVDCKEGVVSAVSIYFPLDLRDTRMIEKMIQSGSLSIVIDALNEVETSTRSKIVNFSMKNPDSNMLITTQPIGLLRRNWDLILKIQPMTRIEAIEFLNYRKKLNSEQAIQAKNFINENCEFDDGLVELVAFDLEIARELLEVGTVPNRLELARQHLDAIVAEYNNTHGFTFPLSELTQRAYLERREGSVKCNLEGFSSEFVSYLVSCKIIIKDEVSGEYIYRHERIADFLIAQHMIRDLELIYEHAGDIRFSGVYKVIGQYLEPFKAREALERLALASAITQQHEIVDSFAIGMSYGRKES